MSLFLFKDRDGQTPLPWELRKGLIPKHIATMGDLDEYEEQNIAEGLLWLHGRPAKKILDRYFWFELHKKLFSKVWSWAGKIRDHELNNPDFFHPHIIQVELKVLEDDLSFWLENDVYSRKSILVRFHERLLTIHPFNNGNGRFSRILCDFGAQFLGTEAPTWGAKYAKDPKERRSQYISGITQARHQKDFAMLEQFMFS